MVSVHAPGIDTARVEDVFNSKLSSSDSTAADGPGVNVDMEDAKQQQTQPQRTEPAHSSHEVEEGGGGGVHRLGQSGMGEAPTSTSSQGGTPDGEAPFLRGCPAAQRRLSRLRKLFTGKTVLLGVDELEPTAGVGLKLEAFAALLAEDATIAQRAVLVQVGGSACCMVSRHCLFIDSIPAGDHAVHAYIFMR